MTDDPFSSQMCTVSEIVESCGFSSDDHFQQSAKYLVGTAAYKDKGNQHLQPGANDQFNYSSYIIIIIN